MYSLRCIKFHMHFMYLLYTLLQSDFGHSWTRPHRLIVTAKCLLAVLQQICRANLFYPSTGLHPRVVLWPQVLHPPEASPTTEVAKGEHQSWQSVQALGSQGHPTPLNLNQFQQKSCRQSSCRTTYSIAFPVTKSCISPWIHMLKRHWKRMKSIHFKANIAQLFCSPGLGLPRRTEFSSAHH